MNWEEERPDMSDPEPILSHLQESCTGKHHVNLALIPKSLSRAAHHRMYIPIIHSTLKRLSGTGLAGVTAAKIMFTFCNDLCNDMHCDVDHSLCDASLASN